MVSSPRQRQSVVIGGLVLALIATPALPWGAEGHRIVADIAYSQLNPKAKAEVDRLLAQEPGATLSSISTWADEHKSPATARWHFVNFPWGDCHYVPQRDCPGDECAVAAIERQKAELQSDDNDEDRLKALKYISHVVGDEMQPLHAGFGEDKGGNKYQVRWNNRGSNLHKVWDSQMIEAIDPDPDRFARSLEGRSLKHPVTSSMDPAAWAEESCRIVMEDGFYPSSRSIGLLYEMQWRSTLEDRLEVGGQRLAEVLNSSLGSAPR